MELFYQHKGLADSFDAGTDAAVIKSNLLPSQHLNIRYTRMFAGAFMYAAGNHIGIEWDSVPGLGKGSPVAVDGDGEKASGSYFGWGHRARDRGTNINQAPVRLPRGDEQLLRAAVADRRHERFGPVQLRRGV